MQTRSLSRSNEHFLEIVMIAISIALVCLLHLTTGFKVVVLNLFYLPVVLTALFLGRYRAGVLVFFSVILCFAVVVSNLEDFITLQSPVVVMLSVAVWGSVLALTALLVGTLSEEKNKNLHELQEAHLGVIGVLNRYLQSSNPKSQETVNRTIELCQRVAKGLKLPQQEIDEIRVAAMLGELENVEVTSRVIQKALGSLEDTPASESRHTFAGTQLAYSLGNILNGAFPLLVAQESHDDFDRKIVGNAALPISVLNTVKAYMELASSPLGRFCEPRELLAELKEDHGENAHPLVFKALEEVLVLEQVEARAHAVNANSGIGDDQTEVDEEADVEVISAT